MCFQFSLVDPDGKEGFPGEVIAYVTCEQLSTELP